MSLLSRFLSSSDSTSAPRVVDVHEASRRQAAGALLIRCAPTGRVGSRSRAERQLIPLGLLLNRLAEVPRDREVLLICRSGNPSGAAQRQLLQLGYERVFNVSRHERLDQRRACGLSAETGLDRVWMCSSSLARLDSEASSAFRLALSAPAARS